MWFNITGAGIEVSVPSQRCRGREFRQNLLSDRTPFKLGGSSSLIRDESRAMTMSMRTRREKNGRAVFFFLRQSLHPCNSLATAAVRF